MTEQSQPWEGQLIGDATLAPYSASEWASYWNKLFSVGSVFPNYGVIKGTGSGSYEPLAVLATNPASVNVEVQVGSALVNGRLYQNDAVISLPIAANASGNSRIDTIILRADYVLQTIRAVVLQGTPGSPAARPALTQNATFWELPLADILVNSGFSTIDFTLIRPRHRYVNVANQGWVTRAFPFVYSHTAAYATNFSIPANGGTLLIPMVVKSNMALDRVQLHFLSTSLAITWGFDLYVQDIEQGDPAIGGVLRRIARGASDSSLTLPGAASTQAIQAAGTSTFDHPVLLPGLYWLAIQNRHATNAFNIGSTATSTAIAVMSALLETTSVPNGDTLDTTAWLVPQSALFAAHLVGSALGGRNTLS